MRASWCRVRVDAKLDRPISHTAAGRSWTSRPSALVHLVSKDGTTGTGELAPLPDYSPDDIDEGLRALTELEPIEIGPHDLSKPRTLLARVEAMVPRSLPAARFALSSAVLDWVGQQAGSAAWELLAGLPTKVLEKPVPLSALLVGDSAAVRRAEAERLLEEGYASLKLKLTSAKAPLAEAQELAPLVKERGARLRLDANQSLSKANLTKLSSELSALPLDLFEEPAAAETWEAWVKGGEPAAPLALDESLFQAPASLKRLLDARRAAAVVLKPTCLGLARCLDLAEQARRAGVEITVSHCFEGPVGYTAVCAVALAVASRELPSGLAPHAGLGELSRPIPFISSGKLAPWATSGLDTEFATR